MRSLLLYIAALIGMTISIHTADVLDAAEARALMPKTVSIVPAQVPQPTVEVLESQDVHGLQVTLTGDTLQGSSPELQGQSLPVQVR